MLMGAGLYGFIMTIQGGDVVGMYDQAIDLCYGKMNEFYWNRLTIMFSDIYIIYNKK